MIMRRNTQILGGLSVGIGFTLFITMQSSGSVDCPQQVPFEQRAGRDAPPDYMYTDFFGTYFDAKTRKLAWRKDAALDATSKSLPETSSTRLAVIFRDWEEWDNR